MPHENEPTKTGLPLFAEYLIKETIKPSKVDQFYDEGIRAKARERILQSGDDLLVLATEDFFIKNIRDYPIVANTLRRLLAKPGKKTATRKTRGRRR